MRRFNGVTAPLHRLVHHYEDANWIVVCAMVFDVLPGFLEALKKL